MAKRLRSNNNIFYSRPASLIIETSIPGLFYWNGAMHVNCCVLISCDDVRFNQFGKFKHKIITQQADAY